MKVRELNRGLKILVRPEDVEARLWRLYYLSDDQQKREELFDKYAQYAHSIALKEYYRRPPYGLEKYDFIHLAYSGLLEAIDKFDPLKGIPFKAFSFHRIKGAISDGLKISNEASIHYSHIKRLEAERIKSLCTVEEEKDTDYVKVLSDLCIEVAIGYFVQGEAENTFVDFDEIPPETFESVSWREIKACILVEIDRLEDSFSSVIKYHYIYGISFSEIARIIGLSKGRVSQIHKEAMCVLRARIGVFE